MIEERIFDDQDMETELTTPPRGDVFVRVAFDGEVPQYFVWQLDDQPLRVRFCCTPSQLNDKLRPLAEGVPFECEFHTEEGRETHYFDASHALISTSLSRTSENGTKVTIENRMPDGSIRETVVQMFSNGELVREETHYPSGNITVDFDIERA